MENPWANLPKKALFVLPQDKAVLDKYSPKLIGDYAIRRGWAKRRNQVIGVEIE